MWRILLWTVAIGLAVAPAVQAQMGELTDRTALRVCADPNNLPYSNQAGEGFENKIAELLAADLELPLVYVWHPQAIGFVRNTLGANLCDVIIGITTTSELVQNTNPYYRSSYVLIQRADAEVKATSLHDPVLADLRIGVVARTPPVNLLARNGFASNMVPYRLMVDTRYDSPPREMVEDVASGILDVGVLWGPIAGYWARQQPVAIELVPLLDEGESQYLDFRITMGLRRGEPDWKRQLNAFLAARQDEIQAILLDYGVPLLDEQGRLIEPPEDSTQGSAETVPEPDDYRMADYKAPVPATLKGATVLSTRQLKQLIATAQPVLIDVLPAPREPKNRPEGRIWRPKPRANIPGSVWLPNVGYGELSAEFERYFKDNLARLSDGDPERSLVFYCKANCWMSWNAAKRALAYGYRKVSWYPEGTDGWAAAGLPLEDAKPVPMPDFVPTGQDDGGTTG